VASFELGCATTKHKCIVTWSTITDSVNNSLLRVCCHIFRNMIDRNAKLELQVCACYGDYTEGEPPFDGNGDEL
jgi:hypothetical protein